MEMAKRKVITGERFLSFSLEGEEYCLEIMKVKELLGLTDITHIPQTPPFIKGVINLRGQIIPIVDLRLKFGMSAKAYDKRTTIIVVEVNFEGDLILMGILVDTISEVIGIPEDKFNKVPYINSKIHSDFIKGIANMPNGIKIVLDIGKILSEDEFVTIKSIEKKENPENRRESVIEH